MPNTTAYSFGDVVLVPFPFTDQTASKKRPAVVVSADAYHQRRPDVIVMAVEKELPHRVDDLLVLSSQHGVGYDFTAQTRFDRLFARIASPRHRGCRTGHRAWRIHMTRTTDGCWIEFTR
jgi:hypothetical protein